MLDRRKQPRFPSYLGGLIAFSKHCASAECVVRNRSEGGARLVIYNPSLLPDEFDLIVPKSQAAYRVRARWRHADEMGVEIASALAADADANPLAARRMRKLAAENKRLKRRLCGED